MNKNELKELCRNVVKKGRASKEEKKIIEIECEDRGISLNYKCPNCYVDAAAEIFALVQNTESEEGGEKADNTKRYILKDGVDVLFGGVRICEATITDELAEKIIARGFSLNYFANVPTKEDTNADHE